MSVLAIFLVVLISIQKTTIYKGCDILVGTPGRNHGLTLDNVIRFEDVKMWL
jgi:ATP-dependent RNA helicase RhlE